MLTELVYRLITEDHQKTIIQAKDKLQWMADHAIDLGEGVSKDILKFILMFHSKYGKRPSIESLRTYLEANPDNDQWIIHLTEALVVDLDSLAVYQPRHAEADLDVLLSTALEVVRSQWHANTLHHAASIAGGSASAKRGRTVKTKDEVGPEAAKAFIRRKWAEDFLDTPPELAGMWHENTEAIQQKLDNYLHSGNPRVKLGFGRIDKDWVIRRGKSVIIAGSSGDGKSTFLNSAIYNMARAGERILYVGLEFSPEEIWEFLAFLHVREFQGRFYLPSLSDWQKHEPEMPTITAEHRIRMGLVIDDIRRRASVPGLIDVQRFFTLDEIINYYETHKAANRYTVVVIDYIGRLDAPVGQYQKEKEVRDQLSRRALAWCAKEDSFVLISPSQVNRESHKAQKKNKDGGYDLDALYNSSVLQHDADLVMSVFSDADLKDLNEIEVKCLKWRGTNRFTDHSISLDPRTKYVFDVHDEEAKERTLQGVYDETDPKIAPRTLSAKEVSALLGGEEVVA